MNKTFFSATIRRLVAVTIAVGFVSTAHAFTLTLTTDEASPQNVGDPITVIADVPDAGPDDDFVYLFDISRPPGDFKLLQDFRAKPEAKWVTLDEGEYILRVVAINKATDESQIATTAYTRVPRAGKEPIVSATAHPLVWLFSATPCPKGATAIRARYYPIPEGQPVKYTPYKGCEPGRTANMYIAGLVQERAYELVGEVLVGQDTFDGPPIQWKVPVAPFLDEFQLVQPATEDASLAQSILLGQTLGAREDGTYWFATNLNGEIVWTYGHEATDIENATLTRPIRGGTFFSIQTEVDGLPSQLLREIDLAGHVLRETNRDAINDDLIAMGEDVMGSFHHEALPLINGHTLVLASVERIMTNVQGPGPENIYGEMVLDLDENWNVSWVWNSFDHLDPSQGAVLNEHCTRFQGGCPYLFLQEPAKDWLHMNAIGYSPADGNLVLSARHQDAVYKIDYRDGAGFGDVIWTLGEGGDFQLLGGYSDIMPWFSHQHDARYFGNELVIFDNGNTRRERLGTAVNSRGQSYLLDEVNMTAELLVNFDLGDYSAAVGSAQKLVNGNYHFHSGFLGNFGAPAFAAYEVSTDGQTHFIEIGSARAYRSFRMISLYEEF